jgi:hypothetical protein
MEVFSMESGYGVESPYVSIAASQGNDSSLVFVSNGDGSGELYPSDMKGLPDLAHQMAGIRTDEPGLYIAYEVDGDEEAPTTREKAWENIVNGYGHDGVIMYQAIKVVSSPINGIRTAASIKHVGDNWITLTYATVDDDFNGMISEFNNAMRREEIISKTMPDFIVRTIQYKDCASMKHVLCAV